MALVLNDKIRKYRAELIGLNVGAEMLSDEDHRQAMQGDANQATYLAVLDKLAEVDLDDPNDVANFLTDVWPARYEDLDADELLITAEAFARVVGA